MATASDVLEVAAGEVGYDRHKDPEAGTKYGRWYAGKVGESYYAQSGVPYCAMFVSWCLDQAGVSCAGTPGAYTPTMLAEAQAAGAAVGKRDLMPGDLIYFDWDGGVVDHVGFCVKAHDTYVETVEGNTSGGKVARRTRSYGTIRAGVRPAYGSDAKTGWQGDEWYEDGRPVTDAWRQLGGTWWRFGSDGRPSTGWFQEPDGRWFWLGDDGRMRTGWQWVGEDWYYLDPSDGHALCSGFYKLGGLWYAFDSSCHLLGQGNTIEPAYGGGIALP